MQTKIFHIKACHNLPPDPNWREQLINLLGSKPRRLSSWCELGMYGALKCLNNSEQIPASDISLFATTLPHAAIPATTRLPTPQIPINRLSSEVSLRVFSEYGTIAATRSALGQACEYLPMPFTFMQTQPGQLFNALGTTLGWHGDGYSTTYENRQQGEVALLNSFKQSALLAWVDEERELISRWIWLEEATLSPKANEFNELKWQVVESIFQTSGVARWLKVDATQHIFAAL
ncbi:MAG: hypothetical protein V4660_02285 [Pseudomonadota bacterium]